MLSSTAFGVPRFSMTSDRRSSATLRKSLPKLARACSAETTILSFLSVLNMANSPVQQLELYSSITNEVKHDDTRNEIPQRKKGAIARAPLLQSDLCPLT